jgi:hypothetical protein
MVGLAIPAAVSVEADEPVAGDMCAKVSGCSIASDTTPQVVAEFFNRPPILLYAARHARYSSLSTWEIAADGALAGTLECRLQSAWSAERQRCTQRQQACLKILGVSSGQ